MLGAAVVLAVARPAEIFGDSHRPRFAGFVDLVSIDANVSVNETERRAGALHADPLELPHCAFVNYYNGAIHAYTGHHGRPFDPSTKAILLVRYALDRWLGGGDAFVEDLSTAGATVSAALNGSTALYSVSYGPPLRVVPQAAARDIEGKMSIGYDTWGAVDTLRPDEGPHNLTVTEIHAIALTEHVPVYTREAYPCL